MKKLVASLFLLAYCFVVTAEEEKISIWDSWRSAYELTEQGERLIVVGKTAEAETKYIAARQIYLKIQTARPDWSSGTISARLKLCADKIASLQANNDSNSNVSVVINKTTATNDYQSMYLEQKKLLETAKKQLQNFATLQKNTEQLLREKQQDTERIALLEKQLQAKTSTPALAPATAPTAEKAKESLALSLKNSENTRALLVKEVNELKTSLNTRNSDLNKLQDTLNTQKQQLKLLENANSLRAGELEKISTDLRAANSRLERAQNTAESRQSEVNKLNELIDKLRQGNAGTAANSELILQARQNQLELNKLTQKVAELEEAISELDLINNRQKQSLFQLRNDYYIVATERQRLADDNAQFRLDYRKLSDDFKSATKERENQQNELKALRDTIKSWMDKYEALQRSYQNKSGTEVLALKNLDTTNAELTQNANDRQEQLEKTTSDLQKERLLTQELTSEKNILKQELFSVRSRNLLLENDRLTLDDLKSSNEKLSSELAALRKKLSDRDTYIAVDHQAFAYSNNPNDEKALKIFLLDAVAKAEKANDFAMSAWYYEELLKLSPEDPELAIKAISYHLLNQNHSAVQELLTLFPNRKEIIFLHGLVELAKKRYPSAQNDFLKLTVADGNSFIFRDLILRTLDKVSTALPGSAQDQLTISQARRILR